MANNQQRNSPAEVILEEDYSGMPDITIDIWQRVKINSKKVWRPDIYTLGYGAYLNHAKDEMAIETEYYTQWKNFMRTAFCRAMDVEALKHWYARGVVIASEMGKQALVGLRAGQMPNKIHSIVKGKKNKEHYYSLKIYDHFICRELCGNPSEERMDVLQQFKNIRYPLFNTGDVVIVMKHKDNTFTNEKLDGMPILKWNINLQGCWNLFWARGENVDNTTEVYFKQISREYDMSIIVPPVLCKENNKHTEMVKCVCGCETVRENVARHKKTDKHKTFMRKLRETEAKNKEEEAICIVCMVAKKTHASVECGHLALCKNCVSECSKQGMNACPICRVQVSKWQEIYL